MADVMYAVIMTHAQITETFGVGIYGYGRSYNSRRTCWVVVRLEEDRISYFEKVSGLQLMSPDKPVIA